MPNSTGADNTKKYYVTIFNLVWECVYTGKVESYEASMGHLAASGRGVGFCGAQTGQFLPHNIKT